MEHYPQTVARLDYSRAPFTTQAADQVPALIYTLTNLHEVECTVG